MSDLGWRAEGIERARAAGGVELETYRRPGFVSGVGVRRSASAYGGGGIWVDAPSESDPEPDDRG